MDKRKMATTKAVEVLMRAIHHVEAAQNSKAVQSCEIDHSRINKAKDQIYEVVKALESED